MPVTQHESLLADLYLHNLPSFLFVVAKASCDLEQLHRVGCLNVEQVGTPLVSLHQQSINFATDRLTEMARLQDMPVEILEKIVFEVIASDQQSKCTGLSDTTSLAKVNDVFRDIVSGVRIVEYNPGGVPFSLMTPGVMAYYFDVSNNRQIYLPSSTVCKAAMQKYHTHEARGSRFWKDEKKLIESEVIFDKINWTIFVNTDWNHLILCEFCESGKPLYKFPEKQERVEELRNRIRTEIVLKRGPRQTYNWKATKQ